MQPPSVVFQIRLRRCLISALGTKKIDAHEAIERTGYNQGRITIKMDGSDKVEMSMNGFNASACILKYLRIPKHKRSRVWVNTDHV
jgi:hypothetical protein